MKFQFHALFTQWMIGFWWWPVKEDLAFGIAIGPFHFQWIRK
jgi:hypothetical protein